MFYVLVFLGLCYLSYCEYKGKNFEKLTFGKVFCFVTLVAALRYGQGTDYFGYMYNYYMTPTIDKFFNVFGTDVHGEVGFTLLYSIFRTFELSFEYFSAFIAVITMWFVYRFIKNYSKMPFTSLTLFYVLYYLVYVFSGMRQGLAIAIFIGLGLDLYKQNRIKSFVFLILLTATIHSSVLITLLIIPLGKAKIPYKTYGAIIALMLLLVITKQDLTLINLLPGFLSSKILAYWGEMPISIMAFANKTVMLFLIFFFSYGVEDDENTKLFKRMYILGFVFYILTIKSMTISSRISLYFKIFEIALIPNVIITLIKDSKRFKALQLWSISMAIAIVLLLKTLNAFVSEGDYFKDVNVINYPYSNMFNKDRLWRYRERSIYHTLVEILYRTDKVKR